MALITVASIDDPRIRHYRDLPGVNLTERSGLFIVEGWRLTERLLLSSFEVESILIEEQRLPSVANSIPDDVPVYVTPGGLVEQIIGFNFHRGVLACGRRKRLQNTQELLGSVPGPLTVVVCEDVHDPTNLGSIARSCAAFGVDVLLLNQRCADPFSRRVVRVSMGAVLVTPIVRSPNLLVDLRRMRYESEIELVAAVVAADAEPLVTSKRCSRMALLIGNEGNGLSADVLQLRPRCVTLEMKRGTDSLNAAVAAGVFLYHFTTVAARK